MKLAIAPHALFVLEILQNAGFAAHVVGGCVRDSMLGGSPHDWDVTTNARPDELLQCFAGMRVLPTGFRHGTLTVLVEAKPVEVTTYRIDGAYSDNRRPDSVSFTDDLTEDLARRDFTINAMAYAPHTGLCDPFGGLDDLRARRIICVGDAGTRFHEDALRILRAARFASVLGFSVESDTHSAMLQNCALLEHIAAERIFSELVRTLTGEGIRQVLTGCAPLFVQIIPELAPCIGFAQQTPYHHLDVWEHTALAVHHAPQQPVPRLTMLLHDIAKPACFFKDERGIGHFYGHEQKGADMARQILQRLRCDSATLEAVGCLVLHHREPVLVQRKHLLRMLARLGEPMLRQLIHVQRADCMAKAPQQHPQKLEQLAAAQALLEKLLAEHACFSLRDLAVNGNDLLELGIPQGKRLGESLHALLEQVIDGQLPNEREALLAAAKNLI